ncbi:SCO4983 family protein [Streptomyces sp. NBC_00388]|uniref:SCO4983 family protein n=1 Tax=Streptomyces sp. NBC_00388 TaxID=2975735 RepID=UPI002E20B7A1
MYEPIRTKSVHTMAEESAEGGYPRRSRDEELDIQLAGHLAALLAVTDELGLAAEGDRIAAQIARLRGTPPTRHAGLSNAAPDALHERAHHLAGRALLVAASRADTAAAILSAERMDAHLAARHLAGAH